MNEFRKRYDDCEFHVEQWSNDDLRVDTLLSCSINLLIARAAYNEALNVRPDRIVRLRHRARVIAERIPEKLVRPKDQ
ncbi:hypothetical protein ACTOV4_00550 [Brucella sp. C7-11G]